MDPLVSGDNVVAIPKSAGSDAWDSQRVLVNNDPGNSRFCRSRNSDLSTPKRPRHYPTPLPPGSTHYKVNVRDISKYFDSPNKENQPGHDVSEPKNGEVMGSNLSRHNGKGLNGRRTQSSGNLCDPKGKLNSVGKILVPCSSARDRFVPNMAAYSLS